MNEWVPSVLAANLAINDESKENHNSQLRDRLNDIG